MPAVVNLMPTTRYEGNAGDEHFQPTDSVVDVSAYTEAAILLSVDSMEVGTRGTVAITLLTALENRDEQYIKLATLNEYPVNPSEYPAQQYLYLKSSSDRLSDAPGFGRYLRAAVSGSAAGWHATFSVQALLKP